MTFDLVVREVPSNHRTTASPSKASTWVAIRPGTSVVANDDRATGNVKSPSSSARNVSTSRSFVGSSRRSTLPPLRSTLANWTRLRSPPEISPLSSAGRCP